jgi:hypothetical protein
VVLSVISAVYLANRAFFTCSMSSLLDLGVHPSHNTPTVMNTVMSTVMSKVMSTVMSIVAT